MVLASQTIKQMVSVVNGVLNFLDSNKGSSQPFEAPYVHLKRLRNLTHKQYYDTIFGLRERGSIKVLQKNSKKFLIITKKGKLQILLEKALLHKNVPWDGKWRMVVFYIPEDARQYRNQLRSLLKKNNFYMLQASVFISPQPLHRAAIAYLKETGLIRYIRMVKVEEMDDDVYLRKHFNLPVRK